MLKPRLLTRAYIQLEALLGASSTTKAEKTLIRQAKLDLDHGKYDQAIKIFRRKAEESYEQNATTFELEMLAREMEADKAGSSV